MNANQRKRISAILATLAPIFDELEEMANEERDKFESMTEGLQATERGQAIEAAADELDSAAASITDAIDTLSNVAG